jgi:hypothetical protein
MAPYSAGTVLSFSYPTDNRIGARTRLRRRRLAIESVRDLEEDPLDPITIWLNPWLRRGRFLASGYDLDLRARRMFYLDSARSVRELEVPVFRIGAYDPLDLTRPVDLLGPVLTDSAEDLRLAKDVLRIAAEQSEDHLRAFGLFAVVPKKSRKSVPAFEAATR